ncbi:MAG TPA: Gfo/Idh/MocA family oxidoreductase [Gaiellaceae bacterium]|nr:Gfo/Idh/MocA family oxidoreductase [Gaiellaceae bacterium]
MRRIAVGLLGAGKHGQRYAQHIRNDLPELTLAALSRRDVEAGRAQAAAFGCRFEPDWRALVTDPAVDAVISVVPPALHPAVAGAVAAAGKPLLIEKPLATTGAAALEVVRVLRVARVPVLMAHTLRWNTVVRAIRERIVSLGPLRALHLNQRFEPSPLAWLDDPAIAGGGIVLHTGVHSFDLVRWLTGREVTRVSCRTVAIGTRRTEDNFLAVLDLDGSEALVAVSGSRSTAGRSGLIDVAGAEGQLVGDHVHGFAHAIRGTIRTPLPIAEPAATVREVLRAFARLVTQGEPPPVTIEDGARAVQIAEACRASAASGAIVPVPPLPLPS